jgi:hypothetical protein
LCNEVIRLLDWVYAVAAPDEPDLGANVMYLTTRRSLQRLASAEAWEVPSAIRRSIRTRSRVIASLDDPRQLEAELLSFPAWALRMLDRRRTVPAGIDVFPRRRSGERPAPEPGSPSAIASLLSVI